MATDAYAGGDREVSIGRVFGRAFAAIGDNPGTMFGIAFLLDALPGALVSLVAQPMRMQVHAIGDVAPTIAIALGGGLLALASAMVTQGALVRATVAYGEGRRASIGEAAGAGLARALPLIALGILLALAVTLSATLFLVPGIMLFVMWSVAAPALVAERCGLFAAFGRSRALTRGARWKVFALELVALVCYWIVSATFGAVMFAVYGLGGMISAAAQGLPLWYMVGGALLRTLSAAVWGVVQSSLYIELRHWKDGPATAALAEIFA